MISSDSLKSAKCKAVKSDSLTIETFENNWAKEWFTYDSTGWSISTHKTGSGPWKAPANSRLGIEVQSDEANELVVVLDQHVAIVPLSGGGEVETIQLSFEDFKDIDGKPLTNWLGLRTLKLCPMERLRNNKRGAERKTKSVGKAWTGAPPKFQKLFWAER